MVLVFYRSHILYLAFEVVYLQIDIALSSNHTLLRPLNLNINRRYTGLSPSVDNIKNIRIFYLF